MMGIDKGKIIRTWRLALTCVFLFLISWYYQIPESSWSLVTIWFVMYEYTTVGGVLNKSKLRFVGTVFSAVYGIIIIYFGGNDPLINIFALIVGLFFYTYWFMGNDKTYTGTIGAVTLTIVLLNYNEVDVAILRVFNVILGILASVFMIRFFYPQYARNLLIETQVIWFNQLADLIKNYLDLSEEHLTLKTKSTELEHTLLANVATYNRLVGEAKMETKNAPFFIANSIAIKEQFQLLFRLFSMFLTLLSTDEIRIHPWVIEQVLSILRRIQSLKFQLICLDEPLTPNLSSPEKPEEQEEQLVVEIALANKESIENLFQEINAILNILEKEIAQSILIYEHYDCAIHSSLRT